MSVGNVVRVFDGIINVKENCYDVYWGTFVVDQLAFTPKAENLESLDLVKLVLAVTGMKDITNAKAILSQI